MKNVLLIVSFGLSFFTFSKDDLSEKGFIQQVVVKSDVEDKSIPKGKCKISAKVYYHIQVEPYQFDYKACDSLETAYYLVNGKNPKKIEKNGTFSLVLDTNLTYLQFDKCILCKSAFETVYLENYKFKSQHKIEIEVYIPLKSSQTMMIVDKPVIYAYSEKAIDFIINLQAKGDLTFTYPQLPSDNSWKMKTTPEGTLLDEKSIEFPYLFWEAKQNNSVFHSAKSNSDELVEGKDLVAYFETELSKLGLNSKEKTDFITFWCPKFDKEKLVQVQFFIDDNCSIIGDLNISPKPDNLRRIYVLFQTNIDVVTDYVPRKLEVKPLERKGFTVIEWGGSVLGSDEL